MLTQINKLNIFIFIGLIWSSISTIYVMGQYFVISKSEMATQALKPMPDNIVSKFSSMDSGSENMGVLINELHARYDQLAMMHSSLESVIYADKSRMKLAIISWSGITIIFALLAMIEQYRERNQGSVKTP